MTNFTRVVRFDRIGLHTEVAPLTVNAHGPIDFLAQVGAYAQRFLAPTTTVQVEAHPDAAQGTLHASVPGARSSRYHLGLITVSLPED